MLRQAQQCDVLTPWSQGRASIQPHLRDPSGPTSRGKTSNVAFINCAISGLYMLLKQQWLVSTAWHPSPDVRTAKVWSYKAIAITAELCKRLSAPVIELTL